jgi:putative endonuclease
MLEKAAAVYILANKPHGVIYVGVTSALWNRVAAHKDGTIPGFTKRYDIKMLVWYEHHHNMTSAILREKRLKEWKRQWKDQLINAFNPQWSDLHDRIDYVGTIVEPIFERDPGFRRDDDSS